MSKFRLTESPIEEILKNALEAKGIDFTTQKKIGKYRVDFYIPDGKIVVEAQGKAYHSTEKQKDKDFRRARYIMRKGYLYMEFTGSQIYKNTEKCILTIMQFLFEGIEFTGGKS